MELEQEDSRALSSEILAALFLYKSPVTSWSSDKCFVLVSLASFSSFIFTQSTPYPESTFFHNGEQRILRLGPLSQGREDQAFKFSCLVPSPAPSSILQLPAAWHTQPCPSEHHANVHCTHMDLNKHCSLCFHILGIDLVYFIYKKIIILQQSCSKHLK